MANLATLLKDEITRLARREVRTETAKLAKASAGYRHDIAGLKRRVAQLEREVTLLRKTVARQAPVQEPTTDGTPVRFSPGGLAKLRAKLDLSAASFGKLFGVTGQTILNWEAGTTRPSKEQIQRLAITRKLGKRAVMELLATL